MDIRNHIKRLVDDRSLDQELYDCVARIARALATDVPGAINETPEDLAGDFIAALAQSNIGTEISTRSDLKREFRRWTVWKRCPQTKELWDVLSPALRCLEKEGRVAREEGKRKYHNNNSVNWYLPIYEGRKCDWTALDSVASKLPEPSAKGKHDKVLKPKEAQAFILTILNTATGEVPMVEMVRICRDNLPMLNISESMDAELSTGEGYTRHDIIPALEELHANEIMIAEEAERVVEKVWSGAKGLNKGRKVVVNGCMVLCCYFIPNLQGGKKAVLKDFGPSSTVQEVVDGLIAIWREWLPNIGNRRATELALEEAECFRIAEQCLEKISTLCSENGYCQLL